MSKKTLLWIGIGVAVYFLFFKKREPRETTEGNMLVSNINMFDQETLQHTLTADFNRNIFGVQQ